jgi:DNA-directed RNA polymerase subunit M/transcription elongation factor TFIIS
MERQQPNIDLSSTTEVVCEECGNQTFRPIFFLRKISRFITPDGNDRLVPIDSLECVKCGHVNKDFNPIPTQTKTKDNEQKEN